METIANGYKASRLEAVDGSATAEIVPELGAIVASLKLPWRGALREVLFQQPFFWDRDAERTRGGLPFLFPVCGRMERDGVNGSYLYGGQIYQMKIHGFGMRLPWMVESEGRDAVTVTLRDTEATRISYPFEFRVTLTYKLSANGLQVEQEYENTGAKPLPYYAGFHPYFLTPPVRGGKEDVMMDMTGLSKWNYNARLSDIAGRAAPPQFPASVSNPKINEGLIEVADRCEAALRFPDGMSLCMRAEGNDGQRMFPFMQLYTMEDQPFFCMEPWMSFPNSMNSMGSVRWVRPGGVEKAVLTIWTEQTSA